MSGPSLIGAPFTHKGGSSVPRTMILVMLALLPATAFDLYLFGWPAIILFSLTLSSAVIFEAMCLLVARKPVRPFVLDGSAILTGWLLAMSLPPTAPWWIGVLGAAIAIVIGKQIFGGIGQNVFNPAMVGRVVLLISFPLEMSFFVAPTPLFADGSPDFMQAMSMVFGGGQNVDAVSSASILSHMKTELSRGIPVTESLSTYLDMNALVMGLMPGSMGETSALLILIGGFFLLVTQVISWHIPLSMIGALAALATLFNLIDPGRYPDAAVHVFAGATLLGAFFIATDLVTSPVTKKGQLIFGAGCGVLVFVIRTWTVYPEGVAFAVLLMNGVTPLIDHYVRPRIYGRNRKGKPLPLDPPRNVDGGGAA
ncbi:MAG: RnfABCDGE type electron transport complex subunit D [Rhodospirillales bacterium]|nr:RnfABCDGE type electron transport complex subunit D [Rhodospirillales bacterium]MCW8952011.1 RnfABCDGE type electron transport complex subunit D [Rhodospirillales bacterium]MCW8970849.1 RnfABCDGE type electron transport complex subunit D [Rhodospirillales bacterium]MCW9001625.1 RnfABCDGE type electron transport complex subunit D [Rhodospirillales bacterium]